MPLPERAPRAFAAYLKAVRITTRSDLERLEPTQRVLGRRSAIVAILHQESFVHFVCAQEGAIALVVRDQGAHGIYSELARAFGYLTVDTAAPMSMRRACDLLAQPDYNLVVAVDGPAGPLGVAKVGVAKLARLSGAPIVPLRCLASFTVPLTTTWDTRLVPLPCGAVTVVSGMPLEIPRRAGHQELAAASRALEEVLTELPGR